MPYYYPRMAALAKVPTPGAGAQAGGGVLELPLRSTSAKLTLNDHNQADELVLTCDWHMVGIDPRIMRNATIFFWLDDVPRGGPLETSLTGGRTGAGNLRFVGTVAGIQRSSEEGKPYQVTITAIDYTDFFLRAKPFGSNGIPDYSQTLDEAFRRIVTQTPGAEKLADRLEKRGFNTWPRIADAVPKRFAGKGTVHVERNTDAWAVWQHVVGMLSLISFVELDKIIVTTPDGYYRKKDPLPVLKWGGNVISLNEGRDAVGFGTGVGISSFDPTSGKTVEGVWPPRQEKEGKRRKVAAVQNTADPNEAIVQKYDWFAVGELLTEEAATSMAKRVYAERSKQEFQGRLKTAEMVIDDSAGEPFSLLDLRIGDNVKVLANENSNEALAKLDSTAQRIEYLMVRGYEEEAAEIIVAYVEDLPIANNDFYVKQVTTEVETSDEAGKFGIEVQFCNRILVDGLEV